MIIIGLIKNDHAMRFDSHASPQSLKKHAINPLVRFAPSGAQKSGILEYLPQIKFGILEFLLIRFSLNSCNSR